MPLPTILIDAYRNRHLLIVWGALPFALAAQAPANRARAINNFSASSLTRSVSKADWQVQVAPFDALRVPPTLVALPPCPILSLDPTDSIERAFAQAGVELHTVGATRDVLAQGRHNLLKLAGDLPTRAGVILSRAELRELHTDPDKRYLLDAARRVAEGGAVLLVGCDPGNADFKAWWAVLSGVARETRATSSPHAPSPVLGARAVCFAVGDQSAQWPAGITCLDADFAALCAELNAVKQKPFARKITTQPPPDFADLEIRIFPRGASDCYPVEMILNGQQVFPRGNMAPDITPWTFSGDAARDGQRLFAQCLADPILSNNWSEARGQAARRRIRLWLDDRAPELHSLPWEMLQDGNVMLAANADTPFSRYLPVNLPWGGPVTERPIRLLAAVSNPADLTTRYGLPQLDVAQEQSILAALAHPHLCIEFLPPPITLENIERALQGYHILHFVGHGAFSAMHNQAALYLQDQHGNAHRAAGQEITQMLARQSGRPGLIFLAACQSAARSPANAFIGLGPQLISRGIPAVLAMQDAISIETARQFSAAFYSGLLEHGIVDLAANQARSLLLTARRPDASVPVLFMRWKDGQLGGPS